VRRVGVESAEQPASRRCSPDSTPATDTRDPVAAPERVVHRNTRLYQVLAWVGIVAGILFGVVIVFFAGFVAARTTRWVADVPGGRCKAAGWDQGDAARRGFRWCGSGRDQVVAPTPTPPAGQR